MSSVDERPEPAAARAWRLADELRAVVDAPPGDANARRAATAPVAAASRALGELRPALREGAAAGGVDGEDAERLAALLRRVSRWQLGAEPCSCGGALDAADAALGLAPSCARCLLNQAAALQRLGRLPAAAAARLAAMATSGDQGADVKADFAALLDQIRRSRDFLHHVVPKDRVALDASRTLPSPRGRRHPRDAAAATAPLPQTQLQMVQRQRLQSLSLHHRIGDRSGAAGLAATLQMMAGVGDGA